MQTGMTGQVTSERCRLVVDVLSTCRSALAMSKMIQLQPVPDDLHRKLKARAALAGMPLSDYLLQEVRRFAERPTKPFMRHDVPSSNTPSFDKAIYRL